MKIRIIQLINNFYRDRYSSWKAGSEAFGEYCAFGYFDALHSELFESEESGDVIRDALNGITVKTLDGTCSRRNLVCVVDDPAQDVVFWSDNDKKPMLFMTIVRLEKDQENTGSLKKKIREMSDGEHTMAYCTNELNELLVVRRGNSYSHGIKKLLDLQKVLPVFKMYSIFAVLEDTLESVDRICSQVEDEIVDCRLRASVKNSDKSGSGISTFLERVKQGFHKYKPQISVYNTLGSADVLIEINGVSICEMLSFYRMGNLMTHSDIDYHERFFNIETEFIVSDREIAGNHFKQGE